MPFIFQTLNESNARALLKWRYEPPYDIYNEDPDDVEAAVKFFTNPQNAYYSITDESGDFLAFCCFGHDAQVPGGDYSADALDIGMGVRPDLTGHGNGLTYTRAVIDFAHRTFAPTAYRVTVAAFNQRAQRVWEKAGFQPIQTFQSNVDGRAFAVLIRETQKEND